MLSQYEATAVTKERLWANQQRRPIHVPADEQISIAQMERTMHRAHKLRSEHLRVLLTRWRSPIRIGVAVLVVCLLSAATVYGESGRIDRP
jgi:hypothetical protein